MKYNMPINCICPDCGCEIEEGECIICGNCPDEE